MHRHQEMPMPIRFGNSYSQSIKVRYLIVGVTDGTPAMGRFFRLANVFLDYFILNHFYSLRGEVI